MIEKLNLTLTLKFDKEGFIKHFSEWCDLTESEGSLEDQFEEFWGSYLNNYVEYTLENKNNRGDNNEMSRL